MMHNGETFKGFSLQTNFELGNDLEIQTLETSPMQALSAVTINSKIEISDDLNLLQQNFHQKLL